MINEADERKEDGLSSRGLDDCGFANSCSVKVDVCALFCRLLLDI